MGCILFRKLLQYSLLFLPLLIILLLVAGVAVPVVIIVPPAEAAVEVVLAVFCLAQVLLLQIVPLIQLL
tara:strand:+ start:258 stop:464 length:207 start_codon:yes stop_codon:yes gene_type:complete